VIWRPTNPWERNGFFLAAPDTALLAERQQVNRSPPDQPTVRSPDCFICPTWVDGRDLSPLYCLMRVGAGLVAALW